MPNVELLPPQPVSTFRKIAIGTWRTTYDPQVYGHLTLRAEKILSYIEAFRTACGKRLTLTHVVAKIVAHAFSKMPDANAVLRFHRIYPRKSTSTFMQVAMQDEATKKHDLSGVTLHGVNEMSLQEIQEAVEERVALVRAKKDGAMARSRSTFGRLPGFLVHPFLRAVSFLSYTLNLDFSRFGMPKDPFGSVMITNIGALGLDLAYVPLVPYSRVPMVICLGAVTDEPVVEDGSVQSGKVLRLAATFDHRLIDGAHAAVLARTVREAFRDPEAVLGPVLSGEAA